MSYQKWPHQTFAKYTFTFRLSRGHHIHQTILGCLICCYWTDGWQCSIVSCLIHRDTNSKGTWEREPGVTCWVRCDCCCSRWYIIRRVWFRRLSNCTTEKCIGAAPSPTKCTANDKCQLIDGDEALCRLIKSCTAASLRMMRQPKEDGIHGCIVFFFFAVHWRDSEPLMTFLPKHDCRVDEGGIWGKKWWRYEGDLKTFQHTSLNVA